MNKSKPVLLLSIFYKYLKWMLYADSKFEVLLLFIVVDDVVNTDWLFSSKIFGIETKFK